MAQSMALNAAAGLSGMLKSGHTHMEGVNDATLRNVDAAKQLSSVVSSSLGPHGMNKLVVNHLEKIIVTSDCASIVKELEVQHPAARMLVMAAERQDEECGDGTNLVVSFAGSMLSETEDLLRMGLHTSEIIAGYRRASEKLFELLPTLAVGRLEDPSDEVQLTRVIRPVLMAKQLGAEDVLAPLVARACIATMGKDGSFSVDSVRVAKIMGGNVSRSAMVRGMVIPRNVETNGVNTHIKDGAKIAVYGCAIEASGTEAKGTVLMKTADELKSYNRTEEVKMEEIIKSIANSGVKVVVSGGTVSEMALHFLEKYDLLTLKIGSKWDLRRLCSATNSTALVRLGPPTPEEMGHADEVSVKEIGGRHVTVFSQNDGDNKRCRIATVLLRASTGSMLADLERAVDDGVRACGVASRTGADSGGGLLVPGAGATEMDLSIKIRQYADTCPGLDQYAIRSFANALEFVPRTLAENSGQDATDVLAALGAAHANGEKTAGVDITGDSPSGVCDTSEVDLVDLLETKSCAFRLAIDAALTVLRVDQIIMSKPAGGGKTNPF